MLEPGARCGIVATGQPPLLPRPPGIPSQHIQHCSRSSNDGLQLLGCHGLVILGDDVAEIAETDLHERPLATDAPALSAVDSAGGATLTLRPFQVVTLRLRRA